MRGLRETASDLTNGQKLWVWGKRTFVEGKGSVISLRGTKSQSMEAKVIQGTSGFNLDDDSDAEVHTINGHGDSNNVFAILSIPFAKARKWAKGTGGIQSPVDPKRAVEINAKRTFFDDDNLATRGGTIEQKGGDFIVRGNLIVEGNVSIGGNLICSGIVNTNLPIGPLPVVVPGFEA